jgi:ferredoxin-type protein NapH
MKSLKTSTLRTLSILFFLAVTVAGLTFPTGNGTLSAFGYRSISLLCPLGALEAMLASRSFLPRALISLAGFIGVAIVLGRVFCAWVCPVPLLHRIFQGPAQKKSLSSEAIAPDHSTTEAAEGTCRKVALDSRHLILGGALLSTALFGFPVFCLICPVGLTFATLIGVWRLLRFNEPTWMLLAGRADFVAQRPECFFPSQRRSQRLPKHLQGTGLQGLQRRLLRKDRFALRAGFRTALRMHQVPQMFGCLPGARHHFSSFQKEKIGLRCSL